MFNSFYTWFFTLIYFCSMDFGFIICFLMMFLEIGGYYFWLSTFYWMLIHYLTTDDLLFMLSWCSFSIYLPLLWNLFFECCDTYIYIHWWLAVYAQLVFISSLMDKSFLLLFFIIIFYEKTFSIWFQIIWHIIFMIMFLLNNIVRVV